MQLRLELQKLKDEDKLVKVQRAKRVYDKKRLEVLEK